MHNSLEAINAVFAIIILYLSFHAALRFTLAFQRRAVLFFLIAIILFASSELIELAYLLDLLPDIELLRDLIETGFLACLVIAIYMLRQSEQREVISLNHRANTDALTALYNHAYFRRAAQRRFEQAQDNNLPLSLIMLDIDDFKAYNDSFGHQAGNFVLSLIAQILHESVRADDIVARYGGEEFTVVMSYKLESSGNIAERIRANVESECSPTHNPRLRRPVTVSLGVVQLGQAFGSLDALIEAADKQMYRAKNAGKNCVRTEIGP